MAHGSVLSDRDQNQEPHRAEAVQGDLFGLPDGPSSQVLTLAMDGLNRRYRRGTLTISTAGRSHGWKLRSEHMSPKRTTSWGDLLSI